MQLTLMTFPQSWDGNDIRLRVLALPRGNPLEPLVPGAPSFATAELRLNAVVIPSLHRLPTALDATAPATLLLNQPADREALFQKLTEVIDIKTAPEPTNPRPPGTRVMKFLTESYRQAFRFDRPRTAFAVVDDSYECALTDSRIAQQPRRAPPTKELRWGQVMAFALRQPVLARALGLLYETSFTPAAGAFANGGWLYVDLAADSAYAADAANDATFLGRYAARIPRLAGERPLFAAVQFPVHAGPPPTFDSELLLDAEEYDDGFAKIAHGAQARSAALLDGNPAAPPSAASRPALSPAAPPGSQRIRHSPRMG
jgi:hypothetical protein